MDDALAIKSRESRVATAEVTPTNRLVSLDAFRGATMALMVLVNNAGGNVSYAQLEHAQWNGWTITDTVFPSFLWIVGVAITLSLSKRLESGVPRTRLASQIVRRALVLYVLGVIGYSIPAFDPGTARLLGVLQRIAICYLIASFIYLRTSWRGQIVWMLGLLSVYWLAMTLIPVPGYGAGNLSVEGNLAHYIDRIVLGRHNYAPTKTWDPEGIVSTVPAIATALLGIIAGHILRLKKELSERLVWMFIAGNFLIVLGLICDVWLPINKKLWTDSFVLFMAGIDFAVFAMFIWFVDVLRFRRGIQSFVIFGMNAITVYVVSELLAVALDETHMAGTSTHEWIYRTVFQPVASPRNASFLFAFSFVLAMYALAYFLYRRKWFLKV